MAIVSLPLANGRTQEHVILLHGLCRTKKSMAPMAVALAKAGFAVLNVDYPSRTAPIEVLSEHAIGNAIAECRSNGATRIHFVTHSLGGILVRSYLSRQQPPELGRVVMIAPPNQGSEMVDLLGEWKLFSLIHGPAGRELGTDADSTPNRLGAAKFCAGVLAGNRTINPINSALIPGPDDGTVSVERTKLAGMTDHLVIPSSHPFIMRNRQAVRQTIHFLRTGTFERRAPAGRGCSPARP